jgi:hypothetical protein
LTIESEERETWTAESLRAAILDPEGFGFSARAWPRKRLRRSTFQVNTIVVQAAGLRASDRAQRLCAHEQEWDLVKGDAAGFASMDSDRKIRIHKIRIRASPCET